MNASLHRQTRRPAKREKTDRDWWEDAWMEKQGTDMEVNKQPARHADWWLIDIKSEHFDSSRKMTEHSLF